MYDFFAQNTAGTRNIGHIDYKWYAVETIFPLQLLMSYMYQLHVGGYATYNFASCNNYSYSFIVDHTALEFSSQLPIKTKDFSGLMFIMCSIKL